MASKKPATTTQPSKSYSTNTNTIYTTKPPTTINLLDKPITNGVNTVGKSNKQPSITDTGSKLTTMLIE